MPSISQALSAQPSVQDLQLGPLHYRLVAHDAWGEAIVANLCRHFTLTSFGKQQVDRIIHLYRLREPSAAGAAGEFPRRTFHRICPEETAGVHWQRQRSVLNTIWHSAQSCHALWTAPADRSLGTLRFHLPWDLLLRDLARYGGGLIHAGAAVHAGRAWLFLAPPGGGKSTTLATAPPDWQVLSDDAALLWPDENGSWQVFALMSWSNMLAPAVAFHDRGPCGTTPTKVAGLLILNKAERIVLERLPPVAAAPALYRALHEYPVNIFAGNPHLEQCFRTAASLVRALPCWRLALPLGGDVWPQLRTLAAQRR